MGARFVGAPFNRSTLKKWPGPCLSMYRRRKIFYLFIFLLNHWNPYSRAYWSVLPYSDTQIRTNTATSVLLGSPAPHIYCDTYIRTREIYIGIERFISFLSHFVFYKSLKTKTEFRLKPPHRSSYYFIRLQGLIAVGWESLGGRLTFIGKKMKLWYWKEVYPEMCRMAVL